MKPRLCEILNVEPYQRFKININEDDAICGDIPLGEFYINKDGCIEGIDNNSWDNCGIALTEAIANPDSVEPIATPKWKSTDKEEAEAILTLYPNVFYLRRATDNVLEIYDYSDSFICSLRSGLISSLPIGCETTIREIIDSKGESDET